METISWFVNIIPWFAKKVRRFNYQCTVDRRRRKDYHSAKIDLRLSDPNNCSEYDKIKSHWIGSKEAMLCGLLTEVTKHNNNLPVYNCELAFDDESKEKLTRRTRSKDELANIDVSRHVITDLDVWRVARKYNLLGVQVKVYAAGQQSPNRAANYINVPIFEGTDIY